MDPNQPLSGGEPESASLPDTGPLMKQPTQQEAFVFFSVYRNTRNRTSSDIDWEAVAADNGWKNGSTAKVRFGQIRRKLDIDNWDFSNKARAGDNDNTSNLEASASSSTTKAVKRKASSAQLDGSTAKKTPRTARLRAPGTPTPLGGRGKGRGAKSEAIVMDEPDDADDESVDDKKGSTGLSSVNSQVSAYSEGSEVTTPIPFNLPTTSGTRTGSTTFPPFIPSAAVSSDSGVYASSTFLSPHRFEPKTRSPLSKTTTTLGDETAPPAASSSSPTSLRMGSSIDDIRAELERLSGRQANMLREYPREELLRPTTFTPSRRGSVASSITADGQTQRAPATVSSTHDQSHPLGYSLADIDNMWDEQVASRNAETMSLGSTDMELDGSI
ncbi:hypothetical protein QBC35DRAFT_449455 [Podospora australis]|uniref:Uncharacterized protein n=1 Tax=Podospora australis TaxID=1536484 RepID=A0AAN6WZ26_9PEZI|nr:hypothetical protein QBC35DRAFT_449455 [Podospora australis]